MAGIPTPEVFEFIITLIAKDFSDAIETRESLKERFYLLDNDLDLELVQLNDNSVKNREAAVLATLLVAYFRNALARYLGETERIVLPENEDLDSDFIISFIRDTPRPPPIIVDT